MTVAASRALSVEILPPGVFRLLLAGAVVVSHISNLDIGRPAVLLFFYLSGYWTAMLWSVRFSGDPARFYASRYLRIAPLYLLCVAAVVALTRPPMGLESLSLLGVASSHRDPLGVSWSLDIELQYYLILPLIWGALERPRLALAGSVVAAAIGWTLAYATGIVTVLQYLPCFVLGALTFTSRWEPPAPVVWSGLGLFAIVSLGTALTPFGFKTAPDPFDRDVYGFFWTLPLLPLVAWSLRAPSSPADRAIGNVSYPLYLLHYPVIAFVTAQFGGSLTVRLMAAGMALALAVAVYWILDRPLDRWRVRLTERPA